MYALTAEQGERAREAVINVINVFVSLCVLRVFD